MAKANAAKAIMAIVDAVVGVVRDAGPNGCPEGPLYAALMAHGCSLDQFQSLIGLIEKAGKIRREGHVLYAV